jgi:hypothetical protein
MTGAQEAHQVGQATISAAPDLSLTMPETFALYSVSEENLQLLAQGGRDNSLDVCLFLAGVGLGFSQNAYSFYSAWSEGKMPATWDFVIGVISLVCLVGAFFKFLEYWKNSKNVADILEKIRKGKKYAIVKNP